VSNRLPTPPRCLTRGRLLSHFRHRTARSVAPRVAPALLNSCRVGGILDIYDSGRAFVAATRTPLVGAPEAA
jgi:hypothetical protein